MSVFNTNKQADDYKKPELVLGAEQGLLDTIHHHFPVLWKWYKEMKARDWSEDEFKFEQCIVDFETADPVLVDFMWKTLLWQWEADSVASRTPAPLIAPFCSSTDLWAAEMRITDNEIIHAATYSEIVKLCYGKPQEVLKEMLDIRETIQRLDTIMEQLDKFANLSHRYALAMDSNTPEHLRKELLPEDRNTLLKEIIKFYYILLLLERVQFMASFAVTFTICNSGQSKNGDPNLFQPIYTAVKKIADDELKVHAEFRKAVIDYIRLTPEGYQAFEELKPEFLGYLKEVTLNEITWTKYLFTDQETKQYREIPGLTQYLLEQWVLFNVKYIYDFIGFTEKDGDFGFTFPTKNPLPNLESDFDLSSVQVAPQEQANNQYKIITMLDDIDESEIVEL